MSEKKRSFSKTFYVWTRDLHYYFGLFLCPYILVYAVTTIMLNHAWRAGPPEFEKSTASVTLLEDVSDQEQGRQILEQLGLPGEINQSRRLPRKNQLFIAAVKPGKTARVTVDLDSKTAEIQQADTGFLNALVFLHITPGPHRVFGVNWFFTKLWGWLADATVYLLFFISISGIYMWTMIRAERKIGLVMIGLGCLSFAAIVTALL